MKKFCVIILFGLLFNSLVAGGCSNHNSSQDTKKNTSETTAQNTVYNSSLNPFQNSSLNTSNNSVQDSSKDSSTDSSQNSSPTDCSSGIPSNPSDTDENPFEANESVPDVLGSVGHGLANPKLDKNGMRIPLNYNGGEMQINYSVNATGAAKNIGFLVYVNGIAQPYKFNKTDSPYEYMHIFNIQEDNKDTQFKFIFTPIVGKKGDKLSICITSVYNPAFMPDMKKTSSYGGYHEILASEYSINFNKTSDTLKSSNIPKYEYLSNVKLSKSSVTNQLLDSFNGLMDKVDMESLNQSTYTKLYFNNKDIKLSSSLKVNKSGTIHMTFKIFGHPGIKYENTFYINHKALTNGKGISFETLLSKGDVRIIEADINLDKLQNLNTFYVISVPTNSNAFPNDVIVPQKTPSVLLYK